MKKLKSSISFIQELQRRNICSVRAVLLWPYLVIVGVIFKIIWDALRNLVPILQFKKREKLPWRSITFSKVAGFIFQCYQKQHTSMAVFHLFKQYKWCQIAQSISYLIRIQFPDYSHNIRRNLFELGLC